MADFFLSIIMAATLLATGAQAQESTPPTGTPSVADAARAQREREKSVTPKHVITNADIAAKDGAANSTDTGASEQDVRAEAEKNYPLSYFTTENLTQQMTQLQS